MGFFISIDDDVNLAMIKRLIILLLVTNLIYGQQNHSIEGNPCDQAAIDAKNDVEKWLWIESGFKAFWVSNKLSKHLIQNPKLGNLQNKSDDYIFEYTKCYKEEVKKLRISYSRMGCVGSAIIFLIFASWPSDGSIETDKN